MLDTVFIYLRRRRRGIGQRLLSRIISLDFHTPEGENSLEGRAINHTWLDGHGGPQSRIQCSEQPEIRGQGHLSVQCLEYDWRRRQLKWDCWSLSPQEIMLSTYRIELKITMPKRIVSHDILRMPVHHRVSEIETFQECDRRRLDFFWKSKQSAERLDFVHIQLDKE